MMTGIIFIGLKKFKKNEKFAFLLGMISRVIFDNGNSRDFVILEYCLELS